MINNNYKDKNFLLPFVSLILFNISLFIILNTQSAGEYEISIFTVFPFYLWIFIGSVIAISIFTLLNNDLDIRTRKIGLLILLLLDILILVLPLCRGYYFFGREDMLTHLAQVNEMIINGYINSENFYPIAHIFESIFVQISGIDPKLVMMGTSSLFFCIYFGGTYLLANFITKKLDKVLFLLAFASILLYSYFGAMFLPNSLSFYFIPLILYVFVISTDKKRSSVQYSILLVILIFLTAFFHPLNTLNLMLMLILVPISIFLINLRDNSQEVNIDPKRVTNSLLLLGVTFIFWFTSYSIFQKSFLKVYNWLILDLGTTPLETFQESFLSSTLGVFEILNNIILSYGHQFIFILLLGFVLFLLIKNRGKISFNINYKFYIIFFALNFFLFMGITALTAIGSFGLSNPQRVLIYAVFFAMFTNGLVLYGWVNNKNSNNTKNRRIIILTIILTLSALIGIYSSYASINMGKTNFQVTESELIGSNFLFSSSFQNPYIYSINNEASRFSDVIIGINKTQKLKYRSLLSSPKHFDFNKTANNRYLFLSGYSIERYNSNMVKSPLFSKNDFDNLLNNESFSELYNNGKTQIFIIHA